MKTTAMQHHFSDELAEFLHNQFGSAVFLCLNERL
jgi:hypothetical protein